MTSFYPFNFNVPNRSLAFHREALNLFLVQENEAGDGYWIAIVPEEQ